ncbi:hypothetical protein Tco_1170386 [Tanacetum coccineum]
MGQYRAKKKVASSSSRFESLFVAGGGLLKNLELELNEAMRQKAVELKREELAVQHETLELYTIMQEQAYSNRLPLL